MNVKRLFCIVFVAVLALQFLTVAFPVRIVHATSPNVLAADPTVNGTVQGGTLQRGSTNGFSVLMTWTGASSISVSDVQASSWMLDGSAFANGNFSVSAVTQTLLGSEGDLNVSLYVPSDAASGNYTFVLVITVQASLQLVLTQCIVSFQIAQDWTQTFWSWLQSLPGALERLLGNPWFIVLLIALILVIGYYTLRVRKRRYRHRR